MTQKRPAHTLLFPLAAAYAMLALPASLLAMNHYPDWLPGLATPAGHGHEMLFGFALAVVAGFLVTRITPGRLYLLAALWLAARLAYLLQPGGLAADAANIGFALAVAWLAAPQYLRAAKKLRNQLFAPALIALAITVVAFHAAVPDPQWQRGLLHHGVLFFALLMFFMGGRIIAPAVAGHLERIGERLEARVQPRVEGTGLALLLAALVLMALQSTRAAAGLAVAAAGVTAAVRLGRWRLWRCRARPDLIGLGIGYAWLALGLLLMGAALATGSPRIVDALHGVTTGALGTLTISVMARTRMLQARQDPARAPGIPAAVALVSIAALARMSAFSWGMDPRPLHWLAAAAWALAYLLLIRLFAKTPPRR
ncbi:MAG TPA: NnrS family protein [Arenicellales bacterium]|nr:NnrS family protein [Arenicellales bacterium]